MVYYNPFEDPIGGKILRAFSRPEDRWRTPGGIAREVGLPTERVEAYIREHPDIFIPSSVTASGTPVYGIREELRARAREFFTDVSG